MKRSPIPDRVDCANWRDLPLAGDGRCLVEASAGTGKTWTIAVLYLRLVLECRLGPRRIVVATYTIAAAQELRERIRARLLEAAAFAAEFAADTDPSDDDGLRWLHARWSAASAEDRAADRVCLALAVAELDLAPIGTLHGLCRRILAEHPFDSGSAFDIGEPVDSAELDRELRDDLWRRLAQAEGALEAGDRAWFAAGRKALDGALQTVCKPSVGVMPIAFDRTGLETSMHPQRAREIRDWLPQAGFKTVKSVMRRGMESLAAFIEAGDLHARCPDGMDDDLGKPLESQFKPAFLETARAHPVVAFAQRMPGLLARRDAHARAFSLSRYRTDLLAAREQRLRERGQVTHDALIERTLAALSGSNGVQLAGQLREAWPVALVDEFQDTDAQQYAILDHVYGEGGRLVMIGDPKQAIYGFRGGDVQAYLAAITTATHRMPLATNFRSSRGLVAAINEVFALAGPALSQGDASAIAFAPVVPSGRCDDAPLTIDGAPVARPLRFEVRDGGESGSREETLKSCAYAIARLLDEGRHRIGGEVLQPGDLAVLLPGNRDIARLRELLAERGVPCVGAGRRSVFATDTACELQVVLHGIEHASDEPLVRAALATRLLGGGIDRVRELLERPDAWQRQLHRFARWRRQWHGEGVLAVVQSIAAALATPGDATPGGLAQAERVPTDLRHLGELLQERGATCDGPESLLAWFAQQRDEAGEGDASDERQLRIESDRRRVQLMTVHASKGLEFPVVFLPLADADATRVPKFPLARADDGLRLLDLGSAEFDASVRAAMFDEQDEAFRKFYVALTRAKHACFVYASASASAGADPSRSALAALLARMHEGLRGATIEQACAHVAWSMQEAWPCEPWTYRADGADTRPERLLDLPVARPLESRHSFSSLAMHAGAAFEDSAASDEADVASMDVRPVEDIDEEPHAEIAAMSGWRGERFGTALHAIFEQRDPRMPMDGQLAIVRQCLSENGFHATPAMAVAIAARVQGALDAPLLPARAPSLRLSGLAAASMRAEMRFHYTLDGVSMRRVRAACANHGEPDLVPAQATPVLHGLMTGAIDLVFEHEGRFHVLDYKSNHLGERVSDYAPASLRAEMDRQHYRFQALLYTIALDRYLRQRLPGYRREHQLGEAIYLFVRAAGLAPAAGVWSHRFDDGLIEAVDAELRHAATEATA